MFFSQSHWVGSLEGIPDEPSLPDPEPARLAQDCQTHWGLPGAFYDQPCPYCEDDGD